MLPVRGLVALQGLLYRFLLTVGVKRKLESTAQQIKLLCGQTLCRIGQMLHCCRFGIGNILESHPISGIDLILCFGCPVDTADIDLTGIIIRITAT